MSLILILYRVHGTQCGFGVIGQTIEQFANQRDALRGRIDGRKLACIVKTVDQLHRLHHGTGADGDHRRGVQTFALAGNQNCGKTTLFNQLTGSNQHVGNFPGVTVDRKDGTIRGHENTKVTDLPGIYSLSPYSNEELVTRQFILQEHPKGIINIVDATNIERNLYLTMQLLELDIPMVLALNMMDEVRQNGGSVRVNELEEELGIPVIPISAAKNEGIGELIDHALHVTHFQEKPGRQDFCDADYHGVQSRMLKVST